MLVSPILSYMSYKYNWRWAMVIAWSGLKGTINLLLAPNIYKLTQEKVEEPQKVEEVLSWGLMLSFLLIPWVGWAGPCLLCYGLAHVFIAVGMSSQRKC